MPPGHNDRESTAAGSAARAQRASVEPEQSAEGGGTHQQQRHRAQVDAADQRHQSLGEYRHRKHAREHANHCADGAIPQRYLSGAGRQVQHGERRRLTAYARDHFRLRTGGGTGILGGLEVEQVDKPHQLAVGLGDRER